MAKVLQQIPLGELEAHLPPASALDSQHPTIELKFDQLNYHVAVTNTGKAEGNEMLHVLKDVSGEVKPGEVLAILGPSGGGKTSILNICPEDPLLEAKLADRSNLTGKRVQKE
jgi:ABC-type glutathione transport system ATPase component